MTNNKIIATIKGLILLFRKKNKKIPFFDQEIKTVLIEGTEWGTLNVGTDKENPAGKLYTLEEALQMENEQWRLPFPEEINTFKKYVKSNNRSDQIHGIWITLPPGSSLFFPKNYIKEKEGFLPHLIGAYWTGIPSLPGQYVYEIEFCTCVPAPKSFKFGVRMVRK